ncbi:PAS domain S-box protein [Flavobacterium sp. F-380]|uniref:histidine kinase n=1 Tax=Flavobacterium kayseriense TaxID=2764714 RepID=A0ABR7J8K6_9FLAO|nr:PAS domain S-box protein [Flavobacterium kayseriense]MBC5841890.1 PAS domain S-box protein [Flavobacterium kayseriense]MBC5848419.1 PAS domain S-box protein [Flavobacterium kayseriense]
MKNDFFGFSSLFYDNPLSCWIYELETFIILDVNSAATQQFGHSSNSLINSDVTNFIVEKEQEAFIDAHASIHNKSGYIQLGKFQFLTNSGETLYQVVNGYKIIFREQECFLAISQVCEALKASQPDYKKMVNASLDVLCSINKEGKFVYVSEASKQLWGYLPEELEGKSFVDLVIEEDINKTNAAAIDIYSDKVIKSFTNRYKTKNGATAYNFWTAKWSDGDNLMYCVARADEEKAKQDNSLFNSELRFKALVQEGSDVFSIVNKDGYYTYVSPTCKTILGISPEEILGRKTTDFIHPEDLEANLKSLNKIYSQKKVNVKPFRFLDSNKEWRWIETVLTNMLDIPEVNGIVANSRDVTKKIKEQQKLKLFESVITNSKDAIVITEVEPSNKGLDPKIIFVNEAFTSMTGYLPIDIIGKTPRILQGPNTERKELDKVSKAISKFETCEITTINYNKAGEEFWANFAISPVTDHDGQYTHWVSVLRDVTEQKIQVLEKDLLSQISSNFSIQNNLLNSLTGLCESISNFGNFDLVEAWSLNQEKSEMKLLSHYTALPSDELFYQHEIQLNKVSRNEGLVGKVWANKKQLLWDDVCNNEEFVRRDAAKTIGLQTILGIPLIYNEEVVGLLLIGIKNKSQYFKNYSRIFKKIEQFVGSELIRKQLENDLSHLFNAIPDVLCLSDFNGKFLKINKWGCELLGYAKEEILFHNLIEFVHPDDRESTFIEMNKLEKGEAVYEFENRFLNKNGETIWISWNSNPSIEEGVIYAVGKNVTSEKKLRNLIQQSNNLAKIGSWEFDLINEEIFWSVEVHQLHETDAKTFCPSLKTGLSFYRDDFKESVALHIKKCIQKGESFDYEAVIVTTTKKERWVRCIGTAELLNGECQRIYGSFQDISERKEAELRLQSLSDNIPGVVYQYVIHPDGTDSLKYVTKGSLQIWGIEADLVVNNNQLVWDQIKAGGEIDKINKSIYDAIESKSKWTATWKYMMPNGELRNHLGYGSPTFLSDGTVIINSVILDVTVDVKNEELLQQVVQQVKIGSWELDLTSGKLTWSEMVHRIVETDSTTHIPELASTLSFCRKDFYDYALLKFNECVKTGQSFDFELVIVTANKKEKWVRVIGNAEEIEGRFQRIYGSIHDISSSKETENRLLSISQNLPGVVYQYLINQDGSDTLQYVSGEVHELWGFSAEEVTQNISLVWHQIKEGGEYDIVKDSILKSIKTKTKWTCRYKYVTPSGEIRTHLGYGSPNFLTDGTITYNSIILDVTQEAKNEVLLEQTTELARIGSWELDLINQQGDAMYWSPLVKNILEVESNYNPTLTSGLEFYEGTNKDKVTEAISNLIKHGLPFDEEILIKTCKGSIKWVRIIGNSETIKNRRVRVFGSLQDINDKKLAGEKLQKAFKEKNEILESIGDAFCSFDKNWIVTYWNKEAEVVLGRERDKIVGKHLWDEYPDVVGTEFYNQYQKAVLTKEVTSFEAHYSTVNKWLEVSAYPSEEGLSVYFKDITLRKEGDIRLVAANERFEKVTEATKDAIWDWDLINETFYRSKAVENFFGKDTLKLMTNNDFWRDKFHIDDLDTIQKSIQHAISDPNCDRWELEYRIFNEQGEIIYVADQGIIIRNKNGKATRMVGAMTDISEEKNMTIKLNELNQSLQLQSFELKRSNEELEQFAFVASHDLQEPLRMITSFMDLLQRKYGDLLDEKGHKYIHYATDGAIRMKQIILDLLDYSRANKPAEGKQKVDFNDIITEFNTLRRKIITEKKVVITSDHLPVMITYRAAVTQIFNCILDNAIKYSEQDKQPEIVIKVVDKKTSWSFTIRDNGIGIDPQFHDKIFVIFQRLHNVEQYPGTGIGLSIAKRHIEFLGGTIWLESKVGEGSIFHFTIAKNEEMPLLKKQIS